MCPQQLALIFEVYCNQWIQHIAAAAGGVGGDSRQGVGGVSGDLRGRLPRGQLGP